MPEPWGEIPSPVVWSLWIFYWLQRSGFLLLFIGKKEKKNLLLNTYWVKKTRDEINTPYGPLDVRTSGCSIACRGDQRQSSFKDFLLQAWAGWSDGRKFAASLRRLMLWCSSEGWVLNSIPFPFPSDTAAWDKSFSKLQDLGSLSQNPASHCECG